MRDARAARRARAFPFRAVSAGGARRDLSPGTGIHGRDTGQQRRCALPAPRGIRFRDVASRCPTRLRLRSEVDLGHARSEEHTSELQSQFHLVCRLLLEKKKKQKKSTYVYETKKNIKKD